ncbi:MAG: helix-turn-helix domain-containing protein [Planctomycetaceae bacterium]|nr:helix-turn-helix domain-containing protein [Planctomycetaceae bacterium]
MGKIPDSLRVTIATNIKNCRKSKYPGRGGGKKCAEEFGVSPQQWSPWERGMRTPDEVRLQQIADFFDVTVEYLRRDHTVPEEPEQTDPSPSQSSGTLAENLANTISELLGVVNLGYRIHISGIDTLPLEPRKPGQPSGQPMRNVWPPKSGDSW